MLISVLLGIAVLLLLLYWSARRHRSPRLDLRADEPFDQLIPTVAGLSSGSAVPGNRVELLENGAYFAALFERIRAAEHSVHLETFLWNDGAISRRLTEVLSERAQAGKAVRVMVDAVGARRMGKSTRRALREAGCQLAFFHNWSLGNLGVLSDRDHRKVVVIDGREGFVGGHCITDRWDGDAEDDRHYADLSVRLHGPVVHALQAAFSENWAAETGELFGGRTVFPALDKAGDVSIHAASVKAEHAAPAVKILHHAAICLARERIWIQNPYFIPKPRAIDALGRAVARGVDVRVLMPSAGASDNPIVQHAAHRDFGKLLECGVRLFEYPHTLLHQKAMTIDRVWTAIGSSNFDDRSFDTNAEITLGVLDPALAARVDAIFSKFAVRAQEIDAAEWRRRAGWKKLLDHTCYLMNDVL